MTNQTREAFIQFLRHEKGLHENTIAHYLKPLKMLSKYCEDLFCLRKYQDVANLIIKIKETRNWSNRTTYKAASICCIFFNWAARTELIAESPMRLGHQFKKVESKRVEFFDWDSDDFKALFSHPDNSQRDVAIFHVLRATGVRVSELANLKISDVDLNEEFISVRLGKGGKSREVPFDAPCKTHLMPYINALKRSSQEWLFPARLHDKTPLKPHSIWKMIYLRGKSLGIRAFPHKFRHSLAGRIIENGGDLSLAAEILGHSSLSSTKIYTHFRKSKIKELYQKAVA